jgi:hypothetical protein
MYAHRELEFEATESDMAAVENWLCRVEYGTDVDSGGKFHSSDLKPKSTSYLSTSMWSTSTARG